MPLTKTPLSGSGLRMPQAFSSHYLTKLSENGGGQILHVVSYSITLLETLDTIVFSHSPKTHDTRLSLLD